MAFPVDNTLVNLTGTFGPRPPIKLPNGQTSRPFHGGVDLAPEVKGTTLKVYAVGAGTVIKVGRASDAGNYIQLRLDGSGDIIRYCHLSVIGVAAGARVVDGQPIGRMGTTGNSTGVHLHLELYKNGNLNTRYNPWPLIVNEWNPGKPKPGTPAKPAPVPAPAPAVSGKNSGGANISELQKFLNKTFPTYSKLAVNGVYDGPTAAVVFEFQNRIKGTKNGTGAPDGNIGPKTKAALQAFGFNSFGTKANPAPAPKPTPKPKNLGPVKVGSIIRLTGGWAGYTYSNLTGKQRNSLPTGNYSVVGIANGSFRVKGHGRDAWVHGVKASKGNPVG